jgi:hypothetical protein
LGVYYAVLAIAGVLDMRPMADFIEFTREFEVSGGIQIRQKFVHSKGDKTAIAGTDYVGVGSCKRQYSFSYDFHN